MNRPLTDTAENGDVSRSPVDTGRPRSARSRILSILVRVLLTAGLLLLLFWQVSWRKVWDVVQSLDGDLLAATCALWIPTQVLQFVKWNMLAREAGDNISGGDIQRGYWVGFTLGLITPGRVGQLGRALALHNCSLPRAFGLTAVERGYTALTMNALGFFALVALPLLGWRSPVPIPVVAQVLLVLAGAFLLVLGVFPRLMHKPLRGLARRLPFRDKLEQAVDVLESAGPGRGSILLLLSIAALCSSLYQFVLIIHAAGFRIPVFSGMLAGLLTFFLKGALPISIGSLGVGEWSAMICYRGLGVEPSVAVASSLLLFVINVFVPSLIGLPFVGSLRLPRLSKAQATA
jgi:uncharacterized membrane protein YbhN (UPF0104 family)